MIKNILVPLDGSKLAECVLTYAKEFAIKLDAKVALISVTNQVQGYWPFEDQSRSIEIRLTPVKVCTQEEHATNYLNAVAKDLEENGIKVTKEVIVGRQHKR